VKLSETDLTELADVAISAAREAGEMIARSRPLDVQHKDGHAAGDSLASQVVTEIDRRSEDIILETLADTFARFELGCLAEERGDDGSRLSADYFWCIDPLDGTLPFIEGSAGYAVSIALVAHDGSPQIGVVYDPVQATTLHAIAGAGAFRDGDPWHLDERSDDALSVFVDHSFLKRDDHEHQLERLGQIASDMGLTGVQLQPIRGAVMNACGVLGQLPACYFKFPKAAAGGGSLWDFAATACLVREAGGVATDIYGDPLDLNRVDSTFMNHRGVLFASDLDLATQIRALPTSAQG